MFSKHHAPAMLSGRAGRPAGQYYLRQTSCADSSANSSLTPHPL